MSSYQEREISNESENLNSIVNSEHTINNENQSISKISNFSNDSKYKLNLNTLMEMGFSKNLIKKIHYFFKPRTLEEAIDLMSSENGLINHDFFPNTKIDPNFCYICGGKKKLHINVKSDDDNDNEKMNLNEDPILNINKNKNSSNNENENSNMMKANKKYARTVFSPLESSDSVITIKKPKNDSDNSVMTIENKNDFEIKKEKIYCLICDSNEFYIEKIKLNCYHKFCFDCWFSYLKGKIESNKILDLKCMNYECQTNLSD